MGFTFDVNSPYRQVLSSLYTSKAFDASPIHQALFTDTSVAFRTILEHKTTPASPALNSAVTSYLLTPLHLAAMLGNQLAMQMLLQAGANPNARDWRFYTPCHHLAIRGDDVALHMFQQIGTTDFTSLTDCEGTVEDLQKMRAMPPALKDTLVQVWDKISQSVVTKTADQVFHHSLRFSDEIHTTAARLVELWKTKPDNLGEALLDRHFGPRFREVRTQPSRVYIDNECEAEAGTKLTGIGHILKAKEDIFPGDYICPYAGLDNGLRPQDSEHLCGSVDGHIVRSYGSLAPDSFPNAEIFALTRACGRQRLVLMAISKIRPGEVICINYGRAAIVKEFDHQELRSRSLEAYWREFPHIEDVSQEQNRMANTRITTGCCTVDEYRSAWKVTFPVTVANYIGDTPSAFYHLQLQALVNQSTGPFVINEDARMQSSSEYSGMREIVAKINTLSHPKVILTTLFDNIQNSSVMHMRMCLQNIHLLQNMMQKGEKMMDRALTSQDVETIVKFYISRALEDKESCRDQQASTIKRSWTNVAAPNESVLAEFSGQVTPTKEAAVVPAPVVQSRPVRRLPCRLSLSVKTAIAVSCVAMLLFSNYQ